MPLAREALYRDIGALVRERRQQLRLTQDDLARKLELTRNTVSNIEHGRHGPSLLTLYLLAEALGARPAQLLPLPHTGTLLERKLKLRGEEDSAARQVVEIFQQG